MSNFKLKPLALAVAMVIPVGAYAQNDGAERGANQMEEVVVSGFRRSLEIALDNKRNAANNVESIVAEDIGKMPDLNLAESLQRVPGIAITREGGEGRQITVRGLGPQFTRSTLNGMEVPSSSGGLDSSGGINRSRAVDFNVFASDIFNRIDIHKSPKASLEEGGLASTVELFTAKPFDNPGLHGNLSVQGTVQNISGELDPRITGTISNTFLDDKLGVLLSVATSERTVQQEGFGTVRYGRPAGDGQEWANSADAAADLGMTEAELNNLWSPRLPRMDLFKNDLTRTGYTAAVQFRPNDRLELGLDIVGSKLENDRQALNYFAMFRNEWEGITAESLTVHPNGQQIVAGEFSGVQPRSESRGQFSESDFLQTVVSGSFDLTDRTVIKFMAGNANSTHDEEQYRFNITANDAADRTPLQPGGDPTAFSFSFESDPNIAEMTYGFDIMDPSNYHFTGPVVRRDVVDRDNNTVRIDLESYGDNSSVKVGLSYNDREVDSMRHDPVGLTDPGDVTDANTSGIPMDNFGEEIGAPAGLPRDWIVADFDAAISEFNAGTFEPRPLDSSSWNVKEETLGGYAEFDTNTELLGLPLRINAGVRVVQTKTDATAAAPDEEGNAVILNADSSYTDILPSTNIIWELNEDLLLRANVARNLTRAGMGSLAPATTNINPVAGEISTGNPDLDPMRANTFDLSLEWYFADEAVLAATYFRKDIESFINSATVEGALSPELRRIVENRGEYTPGDPRFDPAVLPADSDAWSISRPENADGAKLEGVELAYQQPFAFLPAPFDNLGVIANYNIVDSQLKQGDFHSAMAGLSKNSYNFSLYYETDTYGARIAVNGRDDYVTKVPGSNGNAAEGTTGPTRVDLSAYYDVTENITITLEGINMTNEVERLYTTGGGDLNLVREYNTTGREILLGVRATF